MLIIDIPPTEYYDEAKMEFIRTFKGGQFRFEHSLKSISEWEAKYKKPFLQDNNKTFDEVLDYFHMMCLDEGLDYESLNNTEVSNKISKYIEDEQSATKISSNQQGGSRRLMTSEVIYAYMANAGIWIDCESWNINRLIKLLSVIGALNNPGERMPMKDVMSENKRLNEQRKAKFNTKG